MGTVVKICGLTCAADARLCVREGADLLGVIFALGPRQIGIDTARAIRRAASDVPLVGVFTVCDPPAIAHAVRTVGLDLVQLHGLADPACWRAVASATRKPVIPAVTAAQVASVRAALVAGPDVPVAALLLDLAKGVAVTPAARQALLAAARDAAASGLRVLLAGGLTDENVAAACRAVRPHGVDVCRGVEQTPGRKDAALLVRFLAQVRSVEVPHAS